MNRDHRVLTTLSEHSRSTSAQSWTALPRRWTFDSSTSTSSRDPRLDFMRGLVFVLLFAVHFDYFSAFMFLAWERFGVVSSAETFVALAGIVTGAIFGRKAKVEGVRACISPLFNRALVLYKANLIVILSIGLRQYIPWFDLSIVTHFSNPYTGETFDLYPSAQDGIWKLISDALLLRCGPHQFQVIGLYACLFLLAPMILYMLVRRKALILSGLSLALYLLNFYMPETKPGTAEIRITGSQFEFGFPIIAWQVLFVHSMIVGYYKNEIVDYFSQPRNQGWIWLCAALSLAFSLFSLNHPLDQFPAWARLHFIDPETFRAIYNEYFQKYNLAPGRLINEIVLFVTIYALLTRAWQPINKGLGWFFIPLGEASLYVFSLHIYLLAFVANTPLPALSNFWVNTGLHLGLLALVWWFVKKKFLFKLLPT